MKDPIELAYKCGAKLLSRTLDGRYVYSMIEEEIYAFAEAIRAEERAAIAASAQDADWISVDERLPEISDDYLLYRPTAHLSPSCDDNITLRYWNAVTGFGGVHKVTHWMPLPTPPAIKEPKL